MAYYGKRKLHSIGYLNGMRVTGVITEISQAICKHTLTYVMAKTATCTESGNKEYWLCNSCNSKFADNKGLDVLVNSEEIIPATGHRMYYMPAKAATCTEEGLKEYYLCLNCGKMFADVNGTTELTAEELIIPATGHSGQKMPAKAATCTEDGSRPYYVCKTCGKKFTNKECTTELTEEDIIVPATGHRMKHYEAVDATCTDDGNREYWYCSNCNKYYADENGETEITDVIIPKHGLTLVSQVQAPTCDKPAVLGHWYCETCNKYYNDHFEEVTYEELITEQPLGHFIAHYNAINGNCTAWGSIEHWKCSRCGKYFSDANGENEITYEDCHIPPSHSLMYVPYKAATSTTNGNREHWKCTRCGKLFADSEGTTEITEEDTIIPAECKHSFVHIKAKAATCTENGWVEHWVCINCNKVFADENGEIELTVEDRVIPATGEHSLVHFTAEAATCTKNGRIEHWHCFICNNYYADEDCTTELTREDTIIPPTGHSLMYVPYKAATSTTNGNIAHWKCSVCGKLFADENGTTEITEEDIIIPAECNHEGLRECEAKNATCTEDGNIAHWYCETCGKMFADENGTTELTEEDIIIPATGHTLTYMAGREPTCTSHGTKECWVCTNGCESGFFADEKGETIYTAEELIIPALGHDMVYFARIEPTCTENGYTEYYFCTRCYKMYNDSKGTTELTEEDITIPPTGHSLTHVPAVYPAGDKSCCNGNREHWKCSVCGKLFADANGETETTEEAVLIKGTGVHNMQYVSKKEPTCTEYGNIAYYKCLNTGRLYNNSKGTIELTEDDVIIRKLHTLTYVERVLPTCETSGNREHWKCSVCGKLFADENGATELTEDEVIFPAGHVWSKHYGEKEPTCADCGNLEHYRCMDCGVFADTEYVVIPREEVIIPATGEHLLNVVEEKAVEKCSKDGNIRYKVCDNCGGTFDMDNNKITEQDIIIPAHNFENGVCVDCGRKESYLAYDIVQNESGEEVAKIIGFNNIELFNQLQGENGEVVIPPTIEGYKVERIATSAFVDDYNYKRVVIPSTVKVIDYGAFVSFNKDTSTFKKSPSLESIKINGGTAWLMYGINGETGKEDIITQLFAVDLVDEMNIAENLTGQMGINYKLVRGSIETVDNFTSVPTPSTDMSL